MLDFRVKRSSNAVGWRYQEIIVTQEYLDAHESDLNLLELDHPYTMGRKVLDVYYNGQRLTEGGGYVEVDDRHIRLYLRKYDSNGDEVPATLQLGDEIVIKEWYNSDDLLSGVQSIANRLSRVESELFEARLGFPQLRDKIANVDKNLRYLLGEGDYQIDYTYDINNEDVIVEEVTGDYEITKTYEYNAAGKPIKETITRGGTQTIRTFDYDPDTGKLVSVSSTTTTI